MKKLLLSLAIILATLSATAGNVNQDVAKHIARNFAAQKGRNALAVQAEVVYSHPMPNKRDVAFYVVNLAETGFVIVSANDVVHPVLGYGFERPWPNETLPPQVTDFFDDLATQIEATLDQEPDPETADEWAQMLSDNPAPLDSRNENSVGPLLTTTWDQGMYYNDLCPEDPNGINGHVPAGCVAVAMAQIINYWQFPTQGRGSHSYDSDYGNLSVDYANQTYDFNNMPNALTSGSTVQQINAVAQLIKDCGVSVNMQYAPSASGAYAMESRAGFINYFLYNPNLSYAVKASFSAEDWNTLLHENLDASQPVYYSGNGTGGHSFVCDGYDSNNYYHFNFGWGGQADGWFSTNAINPGAHQFNSSQVAIVGIVPDGTGKVVLGHTRGASSFVIDDYFDFYHVLGHNLYEGPSTYQYECSTRTSFSSNNPADQIVIDALTQFGYATRVFDGPYNMTNYIGSFISYEILYALDYYPMETSSNLLTVSSGGTSTCRYGFQYHIQRNSDCRIVSHFEAHTDISSVCLNWQEHGASNSWEVEFGPAGFSQGEGTTITTNTNSACIDGLTFNENYDFYVRPACGSNLGYMWKKVTLHPDKPYWHERVTSQPNGFVYDSDGNIYLYSSEALGWFNALANGYCDGSVHRFNDTTVYLMTDCDLGQYRWAPIDYFTGTFDGRNHTISNMYINEDKHGGLGGNNMCCIGMFRMCRDHANLKNLTLYNSFITGGSGVGALIGSTETMDMYYPTPTDEDGATVDNVHVVSTNITGLGEVGGLVGHALSVEASNCSSTGIVNGCSERTGGLMGYMMFSQCYNSFSTATIGLPSLEYSDLSRGGAIGLAENSNTINNCYASGLVQHKPLGLYPYPEYGKVIGGAENHYPVNNIFNYVYGYDVNPSIPLYGTYVEPFPVVSDTSVFTNSGNHFHLNSAVTINGLQYTNLLDALNAWVDDNNSENLYLHWVADATMVNGGFPMHNRTGAPNSYLITAAATPETGGTIVGSGVYDEGEICRLKAFSNEGYAFSNWTKDNVVVSTDSTLSFSVTENAFYVANFSSLTPYFTISTTCDPSEGGFIEGSGTYEQGSLCTLNATPNTGYQFVNWTENGQEVSQSMSYSFTVTNDRQLVAHISVVSEVDAHDDEAVTVYPNPAHDKLYIESPQRILVCELFTTVGSRVYHGSDNGTKVEIPLEALPAGLYLVRITTQDLVLTKRFVKE